MDPSSVSPSSILLHNLSLRYPNPYSVIQRYNRTLRVIGHGTCGNVFASDSLPGVVYKKGQDEQSLISDHDTTFLVGLCMDRYGWSLRQYYPHISLPKVPRIISRFSAQDDEWWIVHYDLFHRRDWESEHQSGHIMQRIMPLSLDTREALITQYFPLAMQEAARNAHENRDCLVRVYLGRQSKDGPVPTSLRNFELHIDQIEELLINPFAMARQMALTLACIHWGAEHDGMGIEFVLGAAQDQPRGPGKERLFEGAPSAEMWVLDFDKSTPIQVDSTGSCIQRLLTAVTSNDPYFPSPLEDNGGLWEAFSEAYVDASDSILNTRWQGHGCGLPQMLIQAWEDTLRYDLEEAVVAENLVHGSSAAVEETWEDSENYANDEIREEEDSDEEESDENDFEGDDYDGDLHGTDESELLASRL